MATPTNRVHATKVTGILRLTKGSPSCRVDPGPAPASWPPRFSSRAWGQSRDRDGAGHLVGGDDFAVRVGCVSDRAVEIGRDSGRGPLAGLVVRVHERGRQAGSLERLVVEAVAEIVR